MSHCFDQIFQHLVTIYLLIRMQISQKLSLKVIFQFLVVALNNPREAVICHCQHTWTGELHVEFSIDFILLNHFGLFLQDNIYCIHCWSQIIGSQVKRRGLLTQLLLKHKEWKYYSDPSVCRLFRHFQTWWSPDDRAWFNFWSPAQARGHFLNTWRLWLSVSIIFSEM